MLAIHESPHVCFSPNIIYSLFNSTGFSVFIVFHSLLRCCSNCCGFLAVGVSLSLPLSIHSHSQISPLDFLMFLPVSSLNLRVNLLHLNFFQQAGVGCYKGKYITIWALTFN